MSRQAKTRGTVTGGMGIAPRLALWMTFALALVLGGCMWFLLATTRNIVERSVADARDDAALLTAGLEAQPGGPSVRYEQIGSEGTRLGGGTMRIPVRFIEGPRKGEEGWVWAVVADGRQRPVMVAPADASRDVRGQLLRLFGAMAAAVILAGAAVAYAIAIRVARPIEMIADDVRTIARGNLRHRTRARAGGEIASLASAVDRMAASLAEARETEVELGVRERERAVALEVQEALLPRETPTLRGYELAAKHLAAGEPGGDFYDFVHAADGRLVLFVADVSGTGVPAALIGGTARAYLRSMLAQGGDLHAALQRANREMARDVRRGMAVTTLVASLDPATGELLVASAGHKLPMLVSLGGKLGKVHADGIALGFDKGPVFDRSLEIKRIVLEPGDRAILAGTGIVRIQDESGEELGEPRYFKLLARNAPERAPVVLECVLTALEAHRGEALLPADVTLVVLAREA